MLWYLNNKGNKQHTCQVLETVPNENWILLGFQFNVHLLQWWYFSSCARRRIGQRLTKMFHFLNAERVSWLTVHLAMCYLVPCLIVCMCICLLNSHFGSRMISVFSQSIPHPPHGQIIHTIWSLKLEMGFGTGASEGKKRTKTKKNHTKPKVRLYLILISLWFTYYMKNSRVLIKAWVTPRVAAILTLLAKWYSANHPVANMKLF